ncbi:MAG: hypothetical protein RBR05_04655 [Candidatus Methanomethylophilaceae archaeon]|nr:hypothetical protein [Candidatus Methanomethylophilaceae archaeon]
MDEYMGIITKNDGKKNASLMVRVPDGLALAIDNMVGNTHSSRPDCVIDGVRRFIHFICCTEAEIMIYLQEKSDADRDVRLEFYRESIKSSTESYRKAVANAISKSEKDIDVLLSLPKGLAAQIDRTVERTECFKNHQEFVKCSIVYLLTEICTENTNAMLADNYLKSNQSTSELRKQIEKMREEMMNCGQ